MITADDIRVLIQENVMGVDAMALGEDDHFKQAGIDSLDQINVLLAIEEKHGYKPDDEWTYRAKKKLRFSMQFATKVEAAKTPLPKSYQELYQDHFLRILLEELGPTALKKIQAEASTIARSESNE